MRKADRQVAERLEELALFIHEYSCGIEICVRLTRGPVALVSYYFQNSFYHCRLTLNDNVPGLDGDLDPLGDFEQFLGVAVVPMLAHVQIFFQCCDAGRPSAAIVRGWIGECSIGCDAAAEEFESQVDVHVLHLGGLLRVSGDELKMRLLLAMISKARLWAAPRKSVAEPWRR